MKAITPIISIVVLMLVVVALGGVAWTYVFSFTSSRMAMCSRIVGHQGNSIVLQNCGSKPITDMDVWFDGQPLGVFDCFNESILPGESKAILLRMVPLEGHHEVMIEGSNVYLNQQLEFPRAWVINASERGIVEGTKPYLIIEGNVYLNDGSGDPYSNQTLVFEMDGLGEETFTTNSNGSFVIKKEWNFSRLLPGGAWSVGKSYEVDHEATNMWPIGNYITLPPPRVVQGGSSSFMQMPSMHLNSWQQLVTFKDIIPLKINSTDIVLGFRYNVSISPSFTFPAGEDSTYFGTMFVYPEVRIRCQNSSGAVCTTGNVSDILTSSVNGRAFSEAALPDDGGGKYISYNVTAKNIGQGILPQWLWEELYYKEGASWKMLSRWSNGTTAMFKPGMEYTWNGKLRLSKIQSGLTSLGEDPNNVSRQYRLCSSAIKTAWGGTPGRICALFSIDQPAPAPAAAQVNTHKSVFWELNFSPGDDIYLEFNATFGRRPSDYIIRATRDFMHFVNSNDRKIGTYTSHSGGRYEGCDYAYQTQLTIPSTSTGFMSYDLPMIKGIDSNKVRLVVKHWLLNTGTAPITNVTIYPTRGEFAREQISFGTPSSDITYFVNMTESPLANETVRNMIKVFTIGWNTNMSYSINGIFMDQRAKGNVFGELAIDGRGTYKDVTSVVDSSPDPNNIVLNVTILPPSHDGSAHSDIWNWYMSSMSLWTNVGTHIIIIRTEGSQTTNPGYYEYCFVS